MSGILDDLSQYSRIAIWGAGAEGRSSAEFLMGSGLGDRITVFDKTQRACRVADNQIDVRPEADLAERAAAFDLILKSPGIAIREKPFASELATITSQTELLLKHYGRRVIGITGTKGKSTAAALLHWILLSSGGKASLVGNIGIPPLTHINEGKLDEIVVAEFSSYQLEQVDHSPSIGVLLNFFPEHLDYHGDVQSYWDAKSNIFVNTKPGDVFYYHSGIDQVARIYGGGDAPAARGIAIEGFDRSPQLVRDAVAANPALAFAHLEVAIEIVVEIASSVGVDFPDIASGISSFRGLEFRLESEGTIGGGEFINDSISTTPQSALAALHSYPDCGALILGGYDRGLDFEWLLERIPPEWMGRLLLYSDVGSKINAILQDEGSQRNWKYSFYDELDDALDVAVSVCRNGEACVFSPGASSYDRFANFVERGHYVRDYLSTVRNSDP